MLKDIVVSTTTIEVDKKQSFEVGGLTLTDLGSLVKEYYEPLNKLMEGKLDMTALPEQYPEFMAKVVACASGEPAEFKTVMSLSFPTQLLAFEACWDLTVPNYAALEKLVARIKGIIPKLPANKGSE